MFSLLFSLASLQKMQIVPLKQNFPPKCLETPEKTSIFAAFKLGFGVKKLIYIDSVALLLLGDLDNLTSIKGSAMAPRYTRGAVACYHAWAVQSLRG